VAIQIQLRRGTAADWTTANPVLAEGEMAVEIDTLKFKVGNGTTSWNTLPYTSGPQGPQGVTGPTGNTGSYGLNPIFSRQGSLLPSVGTQRFYVERAGTITAIRATVGTPCQGTIPILVDVLVNGVSALNTPIALQANAYTALGSLAQVSVLPGDYFTVSILQIGSVTAGANLTVTLVIQ
jgi:Major tropism determinant N-terminal domain